MASSTLGRNCGSYGVHLRARFPSPSPPPSASVSSSSKYYTTISSFPSRYTISSTKNSTGLSYPHCLFLSLSTTSSSCRTRRMKLFTPPLHSHSPSPLKEIRSRSFVHSLSASQEGHGFSNEASSVRFPPHTMKEDSSKIKEISSSQIDIIQTPEETSSPPPAILPRKVPRRTITKKKESLGEEIKLSSTSEEASSLLLSASSPQKAASRKEATTSSSTSTTQTELSSALEEASRASVPRKVTRKRKKDESIESQCLSSSIEDHSSEIVLTLNEVSSTKRVSRKKKDCSTLSPVSASSKDQIEGSSFTLEESSSSSLPMRRSRRKKDVLISSEDNQMKDVIISSSAVLEEASLPVSARKVSRKKKNDTLVSAEVHTISDGEIISSVPNQASPSLKKLVHRKKIAGNEVVSSSTLTETDMQEDGNAAESPILSPLISSKKISKKKKKHDNLVTETSISSSTNALSTSYIAVSPIKEKATLSMKREGREEVLSSSVLEDHSFISTSIKGKQGEINSENTEVHDQKVLEKSSPMKENSSFEFQEKITLASSNGEMETSVRTIQSVSSVVSSQAPLQRKTLLPNLSEKDDLMFSDDTAFRKLSDRESSTKPTSVFGAFKYDQSLENEHTKESLHKRAQLNKEMHSQSEITEQGSRKSENTMQENHFKSNRMEDRSKLLKLREDERDIEGRFNGANKRFGLPNDPSNQRNVRNSTPSRREKFENQSAKRRNEREILQRQEHVRPPREGRSLIKSGGVNENQNQTKETFLENNYQTANFVGRSNEKFGNSYSTLRRSNSSHKESSTMGLKRTRKIEDFQGSERYSLGGQYMLNTHRARGLDKKERKQFSVRNVLANQASTTSYMQIYGTGFDTGDTVPTVFLFFDRRRFIFNVGEGLLRFCMENRFKPSKIDHVFLTRVCSETTGGLPGLILTMAELGESGMAAQTWGPSNLQNLGKALRTFVPSGWLEHAHCFGPEDPSVADCSSPIFLMADELIKISAVLLYHGKQSSGSKAIENTSQRSLDGYKCPSTVYICELSEVKGKFDPAKALAKGLKPGYKYGKLQKGESVRADDGITMVHPDDVLGPSCPGPIMILVDCPSLSYLPSLISAKGLQSYFSDAGKVVNCMVHITPISVASSKEYQCWMEKFNDTHHIMANQQLVASGKPTLRCSAGTLSKLNFVCPQLFPVILPESLIPQYKRRVHGIKEEGDTKMCVADNLLKFRFRPLANLGPDDSDVPSDFDFNLSQSAEALKAREISQRVFENWSRLISSPGFLQNEGYMGAQKIPSCLKGISREEMEFIFLGTGSSQPSRHRNVTSIYIHLFKRGGILLDCGEGTYAQLKRRYGWEGADEVLMGLKLVWISHMHADHFMGLVRVLSARRKLIEEACAPCERLLVIGPKQLKVFLDAYGTIEDLLMDFLDCSQTTFDAEEFSKDNAEYDRPGGNASLLKKGGLISAPPQNGFRQSQMQHYWMYPGFHIQQGVDIEGRKNLRRALNSLGLKNLFSIPVVHCPNAFAVVIQAHGRKLNGNAMERGWKFVFSGDTRPCKAVVEAARGATVLVHEATFDDGMLSEAVKKNHSITKEAIEVGVKAGAYRIFLTHFSQRYPAVPVFDTIHNNTTSIAFDMMTVNLADLPVVPQVLPAFRLLFSLPPEDEDS